MKPVIYAYDLRVTAMRNVMRRRQDRDREAINRETDQEYESLLRERTFAGCDIVYGRDLP